MYAVRQPPHFVAFHCPFSDALVPFGAPMPNRRRRKRQRRKQPFPCPTPPGRQVSGPDGSGLWAGASLAELRLLRTAIRQDWPVREQRRASILAETGALIQAERARVAIAAAWIFLTATAANMRAERETRSLSPGVVVLNRVQPGVGRR